MRLGTKVTEICPRLTLDSPRKTVSSDVAIKKAAQAGCYETE
jgi:hypothetical protein